MKSTVTSMFVVSVAITLIGAAQGANDQPAAKPIAQSKAASVQAAEPWSAAAGKPAFQAGRSDGYYIWHDGTTVTVATTSEEKAEKKFKMEITLQGGTIGNVQGGKLEKNDAFHQPQPNMLILKFHTAEGMDQISFVVQGGSSLMFRAIEEGKKTRHVFYGAKSTQAARDPLVFDLTR